MGLVNMWPIVGVPIVRSLCGWLENALKDGKIDRLEIAKLGETIVRMGIIGLGAYYGLNGVGVDISIFGAAAGAVVLDFILKAIKKKK